MKTSWPSLDEACKGGKALTGERRAMLKNIVSAPE
jgi:hypothetical protein